MSVSAATGPGGGGWLSRQVALLAEAWARGRPLTAAELIAERPDLDADDAIRLIYEEVCLRREAGLPVDSAEVVARYPRYREGLQALLECDRLLRPPGDAVVFPEAGEALGPFQLLAELGRGAAGRTFLATDPTLADRPVVVKVIPDDQEEHLALARLRHTHIVPLFSEHSLRDRGLRLLCMPDLGGTSLAAVLADLAPTPPGRRTGRMLVAAVDRAPRPADDDTRALDGPDRRSLQEASYEQAIVWICGCLADALHYAHARGLVHMDVKPSNVLLTADGQPMLLDFHLARRPIDAGDLVLDRLGGTPGWMSPEQHAAMQAVLAAGPVPGAVDGRSDLYALGLLLAEALGLPRDRDAARPAWVGVGLHDIVRRCLAPDPRDRYPDAAALADDLRRHLHDRPLAGVRNRSIGERWRKWRRRHPAAPGWLAAAAAALVAAAVGLTVAYGARQASLGRVQGLLRQGRDLRLAGQLDRSAQVLDEGLAQVRGLAAAAGVAAGLERERAATDRARLATDVHALADLLRSRHALELPPRAESEALLRSCRALWSRRDRLAAGPDAAAKDGVAPAGSLGTEASLRADLVELAAIQADLIVRLADPDPVALAAARREAVALLDAAQGDFGPSFALRSRRAALDPAGAPAPGAPRTAWEHDDQGRFLLREGRLAEAEAEFRQALERQPGNFWANFGQGLCAYRLGRPADALAAFRVCAALAPDRAACYHNRGLALEALGDHEAAARDYSRALELDPRLTAAWLNRGILAYNAGEPARAIADFRRALATRPDPALQGRILYNLALAQRVHGDPTGARRSAERALSLGVAEAAALRAP